MAICSLLTQTLILFRNTLTGAFRMMFDRSVVVPRCPVHLTHENQPLWGGGTQGEGKSGPWAERAADAKALGWALEDQEEDGRRLVLTGRVVGKDPRCSGMGGQLVGHEKD